MNLIKQAVDESPYAIRGKITEAGPQYDDVYFMSYEASSLKLATTVYYHNTPTEVVKSDINSRVNDSFKANGVEIPYNYINVVQK